MLPVNIIKNLILKVIIILVNIKEKIHALISIKTIIDESLFQLNNVFQNMPYSGNIVEYTARFLLKIEYCPVKLLKIVFLIRNIVPIIFVLEIVLYNRLTFYKQLILLLIPLIINVIIYNIRIGTNIKLKA